METERQVIYVAKDFIPGRIKEGELVVAQTFQFGNLHIEIQSTSDTAIYRFKGEVDESFKGDQVPFAKQGRVVFELEGIKAFNSCGIREWIYFIRNFSDQVQLYFRGCSVAVVDQINMVPESRGQALIESFYAPYFSSAQGEVNKLIESPQIAEIMRSGKAPLFFDNAGKELEFDALEESYFLFLHDQTITSKAS